jgi:hypothetical protein
MGLGSGEGEEKNVGNEPVLLFAPVETFDDKRSTLHEEMRSDEMIAGESKANHAIVPLTKGTDEEPRC